MSSLTLANVVVTDLATNLGAVYSWDNPAPVYPTDINLNAGTTDLLCMNYGSGPGADGGSLQVVPPAALAGGQTFSATMGVSADGSTCGTGTYNDGDTSATSSIELDQYVFTPGPNPVTTVAVQYRLHELVRRRSRAPSPTTSSRPIPATGTTCSGSRASSGFGNDNYLVYLDGAQYYNLNRPMVGMAPSPDHGGYWLVGVRRRRLHIRRRHFYGSTGSLVLNRPVVGIAVDPGRQGLLARRLRRRGLRLR